MSPGNQGVFQRVWMVGAEIFALALKYVTQEVLEL